MLPRVIIERALAVALLSLSLALPVSAKPTAVSELFGLAIKLGGYEEFCKSSECKMPAVALVEIPDQDIRGQFSLLDPTRIKINTDHTELPGSPAWNSTIVHEFVHYLQWRSGVFKMGNTCSDNVTKVEAPAYAAQAAYLKQFDIEMDYSFTLILLSMGCISE